MIRKGENMTDSVNEVEEQNEEVQIREIVEIEWEEIKDVFEMREHLVSMKDYFRDFSLNYEKNKAAILARIVEIESQMYEMASALKEKSDLDEGTTYDLKLPTKKEDKAYFVKRD